MKFPLISEPILTNSEFFLIHAFGFISLTRAYAISPFSSSLFTMELIIIFLMLSSLHVLVARRLCLLMPAAI